MLTQQQKTKEKKFRVFTARLPETLWDELKELAEKNKRSTTGQIEFILENYLKELIAENESQ